MGVGAQRAHRIAWYLSFGPIPPGLCVLHKCDVMRCVRHDHLFLGTHADNSADRDAKGRQVTRVKITPLLAEVLAVMDRATSFGRPQLARWFGVEKRTIWRVLSRGGASC